MAEQYFKTASGVVVTNGPLTIKPSNFEGGATEITQTEYDRILLEIAGIVQHRPVLLNTEATKTAKAKK